MSRTWLVSAVWVLFLIIDAQPLIAAEEKAVVDVLGNEIKAGQAYYVVSAIRGAGGGGVSRAIKKGTSNYYVMQEGFDVDNGSPLIFIPKWGITGPTTIYESDDIILKFVDTNGVWVPDDEGYVKVDNIASLPFQSWFRIVEVGNSDAYKFVFCRARAACVDVGITFKDNTRWLSFSNDPFVFVIVPASQAGLIRQKI